MFGATLALREIIAAQNASGGGCRGYSGCAICKDAVDVWFSDWLHDYAYDAYTDSWVRSLPEGRACIECLNTGENTDG